MTGEALPGRPGTLTPDQEEKLREFWIATLQVFGVLDPKELNGNELAEIGNGRTKADTASTKKPEKEKKKKRMSLFRKNKDDDTDSVTSTDSAPHPIVADSDDKYGQTKEFHEALASLTPETLRATFWSMEARSSGCLAPKVSESQEMGCGKGVSDDGIYDEMEICGCSCG